MDLTDDHKPIALSAEDLSPPLFASTFASTVCRLFAYLITYICILALLNSTWSLHANMSNPSTEEARHALLDRGKEVVRPSPGLLLLIQVNNTRIKTHIADGRYDFRRQR